jgi:hypothetical protein
LEERSRWESGVQEEVEEWVKDVETAEGERAWRERKLCRVEACRCFM